MKARDGQPPLAHYTSASERSAAQFMGSYSTSFGIATKLLGPRHRQHIRNIYALVRVADELVDGVAAEAGMDHAMQLESLNAFEAQTERAMTIGYCSNPVVHAFSITAREAGIGADLTRPFFASMRMDLEAAQMPGVSAEHSAIEIARYNAAELADYIYGSAEVVGLMCLRVFVRDHNVTDETHRTLEHGARSLGAAFQTINFLRDIGDDTSRLGRSYLSPDSRLGPDLHAQWVRTIREQLHAAHETLPLLPHDARLAVACAYRLFASLTDRIENTPPEMLYERRVRVSGPNKTLVILQSMLHTWRMRTT